MTLTDVAFAAGFGSVRQFNDTMREVFDVAAVRAPRGRPPSGGRGRRTGAGAAPPADAAPFAGARRARVPRRAGDPGRRVVGRHVYRGRCRCRAATASSTSRPRRPRRRPVGSPMERPRDGGATDPPAARPRRRPEAVDAALGAIRRCARSSRGRRAGARRPASTRTRRRCGRSSASRCRSPARARSPAGSSPRSATAAIADDELTHVFPSPGALAAPGRRRSRCRPLAPTRSGGSPPRSPTAASRSTPASTRTRRGRRCSSSRAIGPWTADYVVMRGLGTPTRSCDRPRRRARARRARPRRAAADRWAPWRSYAVHHLWASLPDPPTPTKGIA